MTNTMRPPDNSCDMPSSFRRIPQLLAAGLLWASPALASSDVQAQFDLVCRGTLQETNWSTPWDKVLPRSSEMRVRVDLTKGAFCIENYCDVFMHSDEKLQYQCRAGSGQKFCGDESIVSSAGPFYLGQDFVFDRPTGTVRRVLWGEIGDRAAKPYRSEFAGSCVLAPFTGLSAMSR